MWPAATPYGQTIPAATIKNSIRSGDYLAITRLVGVSWPLAAARCSQRVCACVWRGRHPLLPCALVAAALQDGLDPLIMFGTGGVTGHSALAVWDQRDGNLYVCESTDANPLG